MDRNKDLETMLGDPRKAILSMTLPLIISYLIVQVNLFVDTSWCSGLGSDASSAVSSISPVYWIIAGLGTGIGVGASTAIARCLGKNDDGRANILATQTVVMSLLISLIAGPVLILLIDPMVVMIGAQSISDLCDAYILPICIMTPFIIMDGVLSGILRSEGAAKRSMVMLSSSAIVNMALDPILIYGADLGLSGAGLATGISTVVSTCIGLHLYLSGKQYLTMSFRGFRFRPAEMWNVLYVGIPRATESILISLMSLFQRIFVIACGGVAGSMFYNIPWRFVSLACVISMAVSAAMIPVCSAALGQRDMEKAAEGYRYALRISIGSMGLIAVLLFVFSEWFVLPFTYSPSMAEYRSEFAHVLRIYAPIVVCMGFVDIGSAILQTLRMAQYSMVSAFLRNLIIIGFLYFASMVSMDAIYYSLLVSEIVGGALMMGLARIEFSRYRKREGSPAAETR